MSANSESLTGLGAFLLERRVLNEQQLREGTHSQSVYGGRLGTNLIELGYIGLDELAIELNAYHGLEQPPLEWLEAPDPKAIKIVPLILLRRHKMLPLHLERELLHVAMLDPRDPEQLDFLETAANRKIAPYVLPEVRLLYWLETHLGIDRHPRYVNLAARLRRTDLSMDAAEPLAHDSRAGAIELDGPLEPPAPESGAREAEQLIDEWFAEPGDEAPAAAQEPVSEELLLEELVEEVEEAPVSAPRPDVGGPLTPAQVAELEASLAGATDRDGIVELVLRLARAHCEVAALFLVRADRVTPFRASGGDIEGRLDGIELPLGVHSVFSHPAVTGYPFRGTPPDGGIDGRILSALDRDDIQELVVQPISIRGRVVNLLYCDNGSGVFGESSVAALGAVAECASRAYERLILDRKEAGSS